MADAILKGCVKEVRSYARTLGFSLTQSQAYELVAKARGFQSANILAAQHAVSVTTASAQATPMTMSLQPTIENAYIAQPAGHSLARTAKSIRMPDGTLRKLKVLEIDHTTLPLSYVEGRNHTVDVVIPLPLGTNPTPDVVSKLLLGSVYALSNLKVTPVAYPYGKYHQAYHVQANAYDFNPMNPATEQSAKRLLDDEGNLLHVIQTLAASNGCIVGFGYSTLDWRVEPLGGFHHPMRDIGIRRNENTPCLSVATADMGRKCLVSAREFNSMRYLGDCHFEVTEGAREGMRIALFY